MANDDMLDNPDVQIYETADNLEATPSLKRKLVASKSRNSEERMKFLREILNRQKPVAATTQDANDLFFSSMAKIFTKSPERDQIENWQYSW